MLVFEKFDQFINLPMVLQESLNDRLLWIQTVLLGRPPLYNTISFSLLGVEDTEF